MNPQGFPCSPCKGGGGRSTPQLHVFNKTATEEEMREEAKVKSERRSFSSAACKSAIEVGLHRETPGAFGGACWRFRH